MLTFMNWMLTDMDSFFASVEQSVRHGLCDRPVGVIPVETDTTCVISASYEARRYGVKVGTRVRDAQRLCPGIIFVQARPRLYVDVHHGILRSVDCCIEVDRVYSIDEWTIRLRGEERQEDRARTIAQQIKTQILKDHGPRLTCSIGIASTRLLAKIASRLEKPNGLTVLFDTDLPQRIEHLALDDLHGIGHGMLGRLHQFGVDNISELWGISREHAVRIWGSVVGAHWWSGLHGIDEPELPTARRSMCHGNVLAPRFRNDAGACGIMARLVCKLAERLRHGGYLAKELQISVRDEHEQGFTDHIDLGYANDTSTLLEQFHVMWQRRPSILGAVKKVDVVVHGLVPAYQMAGSLFEENVKRDRLSRAIDKINMRLGPLSIYFAPLHDYRQIMESKIVFGRIPSEFE